MTTHPLLECRELFLQRGGVDVLKGVSLRLCKGDTMALIGANGSGKTSLLLAMARLLPFRQGGLLVRGDELSGERSLLDYRRKVAMVFQEPLLLDTTVANNVAVGLSLRGMPRRERHHRVNETLEMFGISELSRRSARSLSAGEARRVSLARAFAIRPELILLDEPFTALDLPVRETLLLQLSQLLKSEGITAVITTHDCREVLQLCNRVAVLNRGRLVGDGTLVDIFTEPPDEFSAAFARSAVQPAVPARKETYATY